MPKIIPASSRDQLFAAIALLVASVILYFGRTLLIPMLLAIFLSFVLTPFVQALQRRRVPRLLSVCVVLGAALAALAALVMVVMSQLTTLVQEMPQKKEYILEKVRDVTGTGPGLLGTLTGLLEDINQNVQKSRVDPDELRTSLKAPAKDAEPATAIPVTVQASPTTWLNLPTLATSAKHILGFLALTIGLSATILLQREDLRNRLISLFGQGHITSTTRAMEEVTRRITRYLLMQVILNGAFGILFGIGLQIIGVEYALLWGLLAGVLRFIPGLGTWMAAVIPVVISLATPGWWQPVLVLLLVALLGVLFNYFVEPVIFSRRTGLSIVSLVIMGAFWTWLWGLPGLVLATPISVCLLVLGSHIPMFHFLHVLLAEEPALETNLSFYQRMVADDEDEAALLVEAYLQDHSQHDLLQEVIIPTMVRAQRDVNHQLLGVEDMKRMVDQTRQLLEQTVLEETSSDTAEGKSNASLVIGCASHDRREELCLDLFGTLLPPTLSKLQVMGDRATVSEVVQVVREKKPAALCVISLPPKGIAQPRMRCKRLRAAFPELPIILAFWGQDEDMTKEAEVLVDAGATKVTWSVQETLDTLVSLLQLKRHQAAPVTDSHADLIEGERSGLSEAGRYGAIQTAVG